MVGTAVVCAFVWLMRGALVSHARVCISMLLTICVGHTRQVLADAAEVQPAEHLPCSSGVSMVQLVQDGFIRHKPPALRVTHAACLCVLPWTYHPAAPRPSRLQRQPGALPVSSFWHASGCHRIAACPRPNPSAFFKAASMQQQLTSGTLTRCCCWV